MKSFYANKVCSTNKVPTAARLAPEEFFSLSSTQEFVFSSLNTYNSLQHITAMSDWFYCYYFGFLFDNLIVSLISFPFVFIHCSNSYVTQYIKSNSSKAVILFSSSDVISCIPLGFTI